MCRYSGNSQTICTNLCKFLMPNFIQTDQSICKAATQVLSHPYLSCIYIYIYTEWSKKMYTLLQLFGGFDSVWMPMVATLNTYIESKIQGHLSYQFCFRINTVFTIIEQYFSCQSVYTFFWATLYMYISLFPFSRSAQSLKNFRGHDLWWFLGLNLMTNAKWRVQLVPSLYVKGVFHWRVFRKVANVWRYCV